MDDFFGFAFIFLFMYSVITTLALLMIYVTNRDESRMKERVQKQMLYEDVQMLKEKMNVMVRTIGERK